MRLRFLGMANLAFVLSTFFLSSGCAQVDDIAQGLISDKDSHPMTPLTKPTYLGAVVDPQFGTLIRRITNIGATVTGSNAVVKPMYSTVPAWNADESLLILWQRGVGHNLYDGHTYRFIRHLDIRPRDLEHVYWHVSDPNILFYPSDYHLGSFHREFVRYNVKTDQKQVLRSFNDIVTSGYGFSFGTDPMYSSWDSNIFGFADTENGKTFAYNLSENLIGHIKTGEFSQAATPAPSGELFYFRGSVLDFNMQEIRKLDLNNPSEHASLGRLENGHDTYFAVAFDPGNNSGVGSLVVHDLTDGSNRVVVGPSTGYPYPPSGTHVSALIFQHPGWVTVSIVGFHHDGQNVLDNEILLVNANQGGKVYRVAHHRSYGGDGPWGYWAEPHAVASPSGTRILFGSDWGGGSSVETYVVELPAYQSLMDVHRTDLVPQKSSLDQNYPNPFNPSTTIPFELPQKSSVKIVLANVLGSVVKEITEGEFDAGHHEIEMDGRDLAAGVYFYKISAGQFVDVRKMAVVK